MCLLSYYPAGIMPDTSHLENGAESNRDGCGFAIATLSGQLITERGMDSDLIIDRFATLRKRHPDGPALFHSRFSTGGTYDAGNCHPYRVGRDRRTVLAHNGVLFSVGKGETRSDTRIFASRIMPERFADLDSKRSRSRLQRYLTAYNKVAVITVNPRYRKQGYLFNESSGIWVTDGAWHSNDDYKPLPAGYRLYDEDWAKYGDEYERPFDCDFCGERGTVDACTLLCRVCKICYDCGQIEDDCSCFTAHQAKLDSYPGHPIETLDDAMERIRAAKVQDVIPGQCQLWDGKTHTPLSGPALASRS